MKKYINNVISLISRNPSAFFIILLIIIGFTLLPYLLFSGSLGPGMTPMPNPYGMFQSPNVGAGTGVAPQLGNLVGLLFLFVIILIVITSFTTAGFLSYLNSKKNEDNHVALFFNMGLKKFGRVLGASLLQALLTFVIGLIVGLILGLIFFSVFMSGNISGILFVAFIITFAVTAVALFFMFMMYEAALTDTPVLSTIGISFKKAKSVYWSLFGLALLLGIVNYIILSLVSGLYVALIISIVITVLSQAFLFYPLYKHASELVGDESEISNESTEGTTW